MAVWVRGCFAGGSWVFVCMTGLGRGYDRLCGGLLRRGRVGPVGDGVRPRAQGVRAGPRPGRAVSPRMWVRSGSWVSGGSSTVPVLDGAALGPAVVLAGFASFLSAGQGDRQGTEEE